MRVWVGEGVNQARTLLLAMLIVGFAFGVLGPLCVWLAGGVPRASDGGGVFYVSVLVVFEVVLLIAVPVVMLMILDWFCRRVVADRPGKFDAKVPMVGKWDS